MSTQRAVEASRDLAEYDGINMNLEETSWIWTLISQAKGKYKCLFFFQKNFKKELINYLCMGIC